MYADHNGTGDVLFPIHDACLELIDRALRSKNAKRPVSATPLTLETFWNALCKRYSAMLDMKGARISLYQDYGMYGLEWDHGFFGAREFQDYNGWVGVHGHEVSAKRVSKSVLDEDSQIAVVMHRSSPNTFAHTICS
jgi:hypothetical protein